MKRIVILFGAVVATVVVGACSSDSSDGSVGGTDRGNDTGSTVTSTTTVTIPADAAFNATDVAFAQGMIPHHEQAIEMADMAAEQASSSEVIALATQIKAAQGPETDQLTAWLAEWGQDGADGAMNMGGGSDTMMMDGMMSDSDMNMMSEASGARFDQMFVSMMLTHHRGAVAMAEQEIADGKYAPAITMARSIVDSQTAEIDQMNRLMSSLPAA